VVAQLAGGGVYWAFLGWFFRRGLRRQQGRCLIFNYPFTPARLFVLMAILRNLGRYGTSHSSQSLLGFTAYFKSPLGVGSAFAKDPPIYTNKAGGDLLQRSCQRPWTQIYSMPLVVFLPWVYRLNWVTLPVSFGLFILPVLLRPLAISSRVSCLSIVPYVCGYFCQSRRTRRADSRCASAVVVFV